MKSSYKFVIIFLVMLIGFSFNFLLINYLKPSYAVEPADDLLPSTTFTTNVTNNSSVNYMENALDSNSQSSSFISNFNVPVNMKNNDNSIPLYSLMKNLEIPKSTEQFEILDDNPNSISDNGIKYILSHGYNITNTSNNIFATGTFGAVTDNSIKQYITQIALWVYIYENKSSFSDTYCANSGCDFYEPSNNYLKTSAEIRELINTCANISGYSYLNYIISLVDSAKNYNGGETSEISSLSSANLSYEIDSGFTTLITDAITPTVSSNENNYMYYSVEVKDPNNYGVYIANNSNSKLTDTSVMNGSFKVVVPLKEDISSMDLSSIEIDVYGHFINDRGYDYRVTSSSDSLLNANKTQKYTNVLLGYVPSEQVGTSFNLYNFVKISKVDVTNSEELPGATLVLTNKDDTTKTETWVSSYTPHYIYLEDGNYTLCETIPPQNYQLNTECIDFTVDGGKIVTVVMENAPTSVTVPDTNFFKSKGIYYVGFLLVLTGGLGFGFVLYKNKQKYKNNNSCE